jgi:uncharacterized paraquat-inducible protein A
MSKQPLKSCPGCEKQVSRSASRCPYCGHDLTSATTGALVALVAFVVFGVLAFLALAVLALWGWI